MPKKAMQPKMVFITKEAKYGYFEKLRDTGISDQEIGRITGYAKSSVSHILHSETRKKKAEYQSNDRKEMSVFYNKLKTDNGCVECGYNQNAEVLDWDHIPGLGKKLFNIARGIKNKTKIQVINEIAKCEVRCSNCHRIKTQLRKNRKGDYSNLQYSPELLEEYRKNIQAKIINPEHVIKGRVRQYVFEYIALLKESKPCMDCKKSYSYFVMDFDHVKGKKYDNISKLYKRVTIKTLHLIDEEIEKCELVCSNCHRIRTGSRR